MDPILTMAKTAYDALADKKGENITVIDVSDITVIADYFVIADGTSDAQITALVDSVEEKMEKAGFPLRMKEGQDSNTWILMDYGDVIVHIFDRENREFYDLERIWSDGKKVTDL